MFFQTSYNMGNSSKSEHTASVNICNINFHYSVINHPLYRRNYVSFKEGSLPLKEEDTRMEQRSTNGNSHLFLCWTLDPTVSNVHRYDIVYLFCCMLCPDVVADDRRLWRRTNFAGRTEGCTYENQYRALLLLLPLPTTHTYDKEKSVDFIHWHNTVFATTTNSSFYCNGSMDGWKI